MRRTNPNSSRIASHPARPRPPLRGSIRSAELARPIPLVTPGAPTPVAGLLVPSTGALCTNCSSGRILPPPPLEFSRAGELRGEQVRLAEAIGISPSMLSMIMTGDRVPSAATLVRLAAYLGVSVDRVIRIPAILRAILSEI